ncbi:ATP-dependent DNA helicase UvrD2 [Thermocrispum agreste]|uniref:ATP-dependent DNA helicase UvrD2 n=1 Tax=Thermocrispum agreste TaxID=37925 RepID=UPI0004202041|nr:ATP-dependent DNA helicase UvrD2 [Thermocrispum agreste]
MDVERDLDPEQRAAVTAPRGPVCVLAGAGTGKTRTITYRIAHLVRSGHVAPSAVLAVTFTARAAGEMRARLRKLGVEGPQALTFHAAALRQLRYFWPRIVGGPPWRLLDSKLPLVGRAAHRVGVDTDAEMLRDLAGELEWAKASLISAEDYPSAVAQARRTTPEAPERIAEVYRVYEKLKVEERALDFDDLLLQTTAALEENAEVAEEFRDRYRCFVVDEYQDVTPLQQRLLDAWLGGRDDLTVVGDANQTIYSFGGASPRELLNFTRRYPHAQVIRLVRDYRSTPQVVTLANKVIGAARRRLPGSRLRLVGQRPDGPEPQFTEYDDEHAEAAGVAARIRELIDSGVAVNEIAVLFRVNVQSEAYEQALSEAGIPYVVRGGERFFERAEVRQAMSVLRSAAASEEQPEGALPAVVRELLGKVGLTAEPPAGGASRQRWDSLMALVALAEEFHADASAPTLRRYVHELEQRAAAQHAPTIAGVTLASLHAAKGLEWDAVFLVGLCEGTLPIQHADDDEEAIEEERRLLYVGVTRAREYLSLSWSLSRQPGGRRTRRRSRFLYGLVPEGHPAARVARRGRGERPRCRVCAKVLTDVADVKLGRCAGCPSDVDPDLLAALKAWRSAKAKEMKVPAYVVFTDATLMAIAEAKPSDDSELVAISGIGATKLERFGAEVLAEVRKHAESS